MSSGERNFVQAALAELSPQQQQIIELAYFSGLRQNEIATLLSVSLQSVQTGMRAGMMKLREASENAGY
jgi:RNA polymerase sigma-70 factor (ECF subfamily)